MRPSSAFVLGFASALILITPICITANRHVKHEAARQYDRYDLEQSKVLLRFNKKLEWQQELIDSLMVER